MWARFWLDGFLLNRSRGIVGMTMELVGVPSCLVEVSKEEKYRAEGVAIQEQISL